MARFKSLAVWLLILLFVGSCTRGNRQSVQLHFNVPSKITSQNLTDKVLGLYIINVHNIPGEDGPLTYEEDFFDEYDDVSPTEIASVDISTKGKTLTEADLNGATQITVQVLAVYIDVNDFSKHFFYDDERITIQNGDNVIDLSLGSIGSSSGSLEVGGRYMTDANGGPTGKMQVLLSPPSTLSNPPEMDLDFDDLYMYNGWFTAFYLNADTPGEARFRYVLKDTGEEIFPAMDASEFKARYVEGNHLLRLVRPTVYELDDDFEPESTVEFYMGYFSDDAAAISGKQACFINVEEAVPELYTDSEFTTPLDYRSDDQAGNATASSAYVVAGGVDTTYADVIVNQATCDPNDGDVILHHQSIGDGDGDAFGFRGPFLKMDFFDRHGGYVRSEYNPGGSTNTLTWRYLPGVDSATIEGVEVYGKFDSNYDGDDGDREDRTCAEEAERRGMGAPLAKVVAPATSYVHTGIASETESNGWHYLICPLSASGESLQARVEDHCRGGCNHDQIYGFGWGLDDYSVPGGGEDFEIDLTGDNVRLVGMQSISNPNYTVIQSSGNISHLQPGDEILIRVISETSDHCDGYDPGEFHFSRVIDTDGSAPQNIWVPHHHWFTKKAGGDFSHTSTGSLFPYYNSAAAPEVCFMTITKVPHYRNLSLVGDLNTNPIDTNTIGNAASGGGVIALRVNGSLIMANNTQIKATNTGYAGGTGVTNAYGAGINGYVGTIATGTGGYPQNGTYGASGGSNWGAGQDGATIGTGAPVAYFNDTQDGLRFLMGGGGGAGDDLGTPISGGSGGGDIFLAVRQLRLFGSAAFIHANGGAGTDSTMSSSFAAGGGAGGSVNILTREVAGDSAAVLTIHARGGDGGIENFTTTYHGGGGGGGFARIGMCEASPNVAVEAGGGRLNADNGNTADYGLPVAQQQYEPGFCDSN